MPLQTLARALRIAVGVVFILIGLLFGMGGNLGGGLLFGLLGVFNLAMLRLLAVRPATVLDVGLNAVVLLFGLYILVTPFLRTP
ncbi:hypothetical protein HNR42_002889 [Deinobacterium chartae]|uniref:Uncharacterized protein n=1 Tax=Deinobacterium chartae TaxID=521158 RepID=A0A841I4V4_9DEIO|nr:hypothetical protein [Deinobacterium chartae]MBB6099448.1 hypothetical protein [Deinobacterium chartae]